VIAYPRKHPCLTQLRALAEFLTVLHLQVFLKEHFQSNQHHCHPICRLYHPSKKKNRKQPTTPNRTIYLNSLYSSVTSQQTLGSSISPLPTLSIFILHSLVTFILVTCYYSVYSLRARTDTLFTLAFPGQSSLYISSSRILKNARSDLSLRELLDVKTLVNRSRRVFVEHKLQICLESQRTHESISSNQ